MDKPLALKLAPVGMDDIVGQRHLIGKDKILTNLVKNKKFYMVNLELVKLVSLMLWCMI